MNKYILAFLLLLVMIPQASAVIQITDSSTNRSSNLTNASTNSTTYVTLLTLQNPILVDANGTYSISVLVNENSSVASGYWKLQKNGADIGSVRNEQVADWTYWNQTFSGLLNDSDVFTVMVRDVIGEVNWAFAKNASAQYDIASGGVFKPGTNNIQSYESVYTVYSFDRNTTGFTGLPDVSNGDIRKNGSVFSMLSTEAISTGAYRQISVDGVNWIDNSSCGTPTATGLIFLAQNASSYYLVNYIDDSSRPTCGYWQFKSFNPTVQKATVNAVRPAANISYRIVADLFNSGNSSVTIQYENGTVMASMEANTTEEGWVGGSIGIRDPTGTGGTQVFDNLRYGNSLLFNETTSDNFETDSENWTNITTGGNFVRTQVNGNWVQKFTNAGTQANLIYNQRNYLNLYVSADFNRTDNASFYGLSFIGGSTYLDKTSNQLNAYQVLYNSAQQALKINRLVDGTLTNLANLSYSTSPNRTYIVKGMYKDGTIYSKMWENGTSEPVWMQSAYDTTLDVGYVGIRANSGDVWFDNFSVTSNTSYPLITSKNNNITSDSSSVFNITALSSVNVSISTVDSGITTWYVDGVVSKTGTDNYYVWTPIQAPINRTIIASFVSSIDSRLENTTWYGNVSNLDVSGITTILPRLLIPAKNQTQYIYGSNTYFFNTTVGGSGWNNNTINRSLECDTGCTGISTYPLEFWLRPVDGIININTRQFLSGGSSVTVYINDSLHSTWDLNDAVTLDINITLTNLSTGSVNYIKINSSANDKFYLNYIRYNRTYPTLYTDEQGYFQIKKVMYDGTTNISGRTHASAYDFNESVFTADIAEIKYYGFNSINYPLIWGYAVSDIRTTNGLSNNLYNFTTINTLDNIINLMGNNSLYVTLRWYQWEVNNGVPAGVLLSDNLYPCARCLINTSERDSIIQLHKYLSNRYKNHTNVGFEISFETFDGYGANGTGTDPIWYADAQNKASFLSYTGIDKDLPHNETYNRSEFMALWKWEFDNFFTMVDEIKETTDDNGQLTNLNLFDFRRSPTAIQEGYALVVPSNRITRNMTNTNFVGVAYYPWNLSASLSTIKNETWQVTSNWKSFGSIPYIAEFGIRTSNLSQFQYAENQTNIVNTVLNRSIIPVQDTDYNDMDVSIGVGGYMWWMWKETGSCGFDDITYDPCYGIKYKNNTPTPWADAVRAINEGASIISYSPSDLNLSGTIATPQNFTLIMNRIVNTITWSVNGTSAQTNSSVAESSYTYTPGTSNTFIINASAYDGVQYYNVSWRLDLETPASVTNLQNTTTSTSINWTWDDPADTDFDHVMIYLNGSFITNVSAGVQYYLNLTLLQNTEYTISTATVDALGNINQTRVNQTTVTLAASAVTDTYIVLVNRSSQADYYANGSNNWYDVPDPQPHETINLTIWAVNQSGDTSMNNTPLIINTSIPNAEVLCTSSISCNWDGSGLADEIYTVEGATVLINITTVDNDDDNLTYTAADWNVTKLTNTTGSISTSYGDGDQGNHSYFFNVSDGHGSNVSKQFTVIVDNSTPGDVGTLTNSTFAGSTTGQVYELVSWDAVANADSYEKYWNGTLIENNSIPALVSPDYSSHSTNITSIRACNSTLGTCGAWSNKTIIAANIIPELAEIADQTLNETETLSINLSEYVTEPDGDSYTCATNFSVGTLTNCQFNFTPAIGEAGSYFGYFNVTDTYGGVATEELTITVNPTEYIPATPISCSANKGNFWVNSSCSAGPGNTTDSMNKTNGSYWINSTDFYFNHTEISPHGWSNVSFYAWNNTGNLNETPATLNTQLDNNPISISGISDTYNINAGNTLNIDADYADADSDTGTFARNFSQGTFNTGTGVLAWTTGVGDVGTYNWQINVSDGNGSVAIKNFTVTVSTSGGTGTDWDYLTGTVNIEGADITTNPSVCTTTGGAYSCGYVFEDGLTYWVNVSKAGYVSNNTQITFNEDHEIWNPILTTTPLDLPNITSWSNDNTSNSNTTISVPKNTNITFNITANQTVTTTWTGTASPTKLNDTHAFKNFTSIGTYTVVASCSNANGSCLNSVTWAITVTGAGGLNLTGYLINELGVYLENGRVDFNGSHDLTDANGYYSFSGVGEGDYTVLARAIGYRNSTNVSTINTDTVMNFTLSERTVGTVTAPGFEIGLMLLSILLIYRIRKKIK